MDARPGSDRGLLLSGGWALRGQATIDGRPPSPAALRVNPDGTWTAEVYTFTFAGELDLFFVSEQGGHFCGPTFVERSRADSHPIRAITELRGTGPLLVVAPARAELPADEVIDAEVVEPLALER